MSSFVTKADNKDAADKCNDEGDDCNREEADCWALVEHGQQSLQALAEAHRVEINAVLDRLPERRTKRQLACSI